jgi:hypothetical protein
MSIPTIASTDSKTNHLDFISLSPWEIIGWSKNKLSEDKMVYYFRRPPLVNMERYTNKKSWIWKQRRAYYTELTAECKPHFSDTDKKKPYSLPIWTKKQRLLFLLCNSLLEAMSRSGKG